MFKQTLKEVVEKTEGCLGALIMGTDGIAVEQMWQPQGADANLDVAVAEFTTLLRNAQRTCDDMGLKRLTELSIMCESAYFVMRCINQEYFLVLVLESEGNFGRGRYELRRAELILEREFAF
jgi:predicted regulator of Ras-like GTPase activity (Roadblock/LC7/MglB family)